ncbi:MAG: ABC transporter ATP-binding protein [Deltaproteobacteria bacterium]|nr:MAG: ABC transporter ATP-binding protein [Deltaproteobacteria bacterium]
MAILEVREITKNFGGLTALKDVCLSVQEGELRGIIGPNGAGKTTLFNVISGDLKPTGGKVYLQGEDITGLPPHKICKKGLGRTFQLTMVFPELTVYESIWVGINSRKEKPWDPFRSFEKDSDVSERAEELCRIVGLYEKRDELASNLSYGDQKALEIAMALSTDPAVLLLDEPTQGVSPKEAEGLIELIVELSKRMTIVLIEHSVDVVLRLCHKVTVLNEGRVIAEGSPEEISRNKEVQRIYLGT